MLQPFQETASTHTEQGNTRAGQYESRAIHTLSCTYQSRAIHTLNYERDKMQPATQHLKRKVCSHGASCVHQQNNIFISVENFGHTYHSSQLEENVKDDPQNAMHLETYTCTGIHVTKNMAN
jgi:hypothetical protein